MAARSLVTALMLSLLTMGSAGAVTVHDESTTDGDLSNDRFAPTAVAFAPGANDIVGVTGVTASGPDRDYFTFVIPHGYVLASLTVLDSQLSDGASAFLGLQSGGQVTVNPAPGMADPSLLLGYSHFAPGDIGTDILLEMSTAAGAQGFTPPLGEGTYSVWIQDGHPAPSVYELRFEVARVPVPGTALLTLAGVASIAGMGAIRSRRGRCRVPSRRLSLTTRGNPRSTPRV